MQNTNASHMKYKGIISKSDLVHSGSPAVYKLTPKTEIIDTLTKLTLGERNVNKINKTILLVGETGTGKSTLINTLVNYAMGVKWEDDVWFQIVEDEKKSQTESQTSDVIVYQIFGFEDEPLPYSLTIIDTPGYGSTEGIEHDEIVNQRLLDLFRSHDGVHEINAVGLVLKGSENRLGDRLRYIFDSVVSLFEKDMENNFVALITHSDGLTPENALQALKEANIKCAKDEEGEIVHFMFNNHQCKQKTKKNMVALKSAWDLTEDEIGKFTDFLGKTGPQNLMPTVDVLMARMKLTTSIQIMKQKIELIELKKKEIRETKEALKKHEQEMKKNKNFTVEIDEVYKVKEPISGGMWGFFYEGAVCCTICKETCHHPCPLAWYAKDCEVMKGGRCTSCTKKCPASVHVKEKWKYVSNTRKVQKTLEDVKKKYEENKTESENKSSLLENLQKNVEELQINKNQLLEKSFKLVVKLEQIALNVNSLSTLVHLDFLIEKMKEKGDTEKVQKLEEMKKRVDERSKGALRYMYGKLKK